MYYYNFHREKNEEFDDFEAMRIDVSFAGEATLAVVHIRCIVFWADIL